MKSSLKLTIGLVQADLFSAYDTINRAELMDPRRQDRSAQKVLSDM